MLENIETKSEQQTEKLIDDAAKDIAIADLKPFIEIFQNKSKTKKRVFELHELETEITRLNSNLIHLDLKERKIERINSKDTSFISRQVRSLSEILEKHNAKGKVKLSTITLSAFDESIKELEKILTNDSTSKRYYRREAERKKGQQQAQKQFRSQISNLDSLISKNNLQEAKVIIAQLDSSLLATSYTKEKSQFQKAKDRFHEREIRNYELNQREKLRKQEEEVERLRLVEKSRIEEGIILQEQRQLSLKQNEISRQKKENGLIGLLNKKSNWHEFKTILDGKNISVLYHFTDRANLKSIRERGGLFSWQYCDRNDVIIPFPGGGILSRQLDSRYGLQDYVRVSFCSTHPMMYVAVNEGRLNNPVVLEISKEVCFFEKTMFSNMNATDKLHSQSDTPDFLRELHFPLFNRNYNDLDASNRKYYQAEVLVKTWIPIEFITNIKEF